MAEGYFFIYYPKKNHSKNRELSGVSSKKMWGYSIWVRQKHGCFVRFENRKEIKKPSKLF